MLKEQLPISLIGFMGSGKTTIGRKVAKRLSLPFYDLDQVIEEEEGKSIREIFFTLGEPYFRQKEAEVLASLLKMKAPMVLSTGGGIVLQEQNRTLLKSNSFVVCTTANRGVLLRRLHKKSKNRPLLQGDLEERVDQLLNERAHLYQFAHYTIATDQYSIDECARNIIKAYQAMPM